MIEQITPESFVQGLFLKIKIIYLLRGMLQDLRF